MAKLTGAFLRLLITNVSKSIKTNSPPPQNDTLFLTCYVVAQSWESFTRTSQLKVPSTSPMTGSTEKRSCISSLTVLGYTFSMVCIKSMPHCKCNLHFAESCELIMYDPGILIWYKHTNILFKLIILIWDDDSNTTAVLVVAPVVVVVKSW